MKKKHAIQVRHYLPGQTQYGSESLGPITGDFGRFTLKETVKRTLRAEQIGNFNPLFCRYANIPRVLVHSEEGDLSDPFRRDESYAQTLFISIP